MTPPPMSSVGICLETSFKAIGTLLGLLQSGISVCMLSMRWPAALVDRTLKNLGIEHVITTRTDLETKQIHSDLYYTEHIDLRRINSLPSKPVTILHTSGTSTVPKAVVHTLGNHLSSAQSACTMLNLKTSDRWLLNLPLWHVSGMSIVFRCSISGAQVILPSPKTDLLDTLSRSRITHVSMVASQLIQLMDQPVPSCLRAAIVGGGPIPSHVLKRALKNGWPIRTTYGMTETSSMVTLSKQNFPLGSSGQALQGNEIQISTDGEVLVRSPAICSGYLENGELHRVVDANGWLHTGDLGYMDEAGELYISGRKDNMFISGGENISPEEIEHVLYQFPSIKEAIVVPIPDPKFGQRPAAFILGCLNFDTLTEFLTLELPKFKLPVCYPWPKNIPPTSFKQDRKLFMNLAKNLHAEEQTSTFTSGIPTDPLI